MTTERRLMDYQAILAQAAEFASSEEVAQLPTDRQLLELLKNQDIAPAHAARIEALLDTRDRNKARAALAQQRRSRVVELSRQGLPVGEIAHRLGIAYNYVVQLRAQLGVPRSRTRR